MSIGTILGIAGSALSAQAQRITLIAQNLANADSVASPDGGPYQRRIPVFQASQIAAADGSGGLGVTLAAVLRDQAPPKVTYDPSNPYADAAGMVREPAVNHGHERIYHPAGASQWRPQPPSITAESTSFNERDFNALPSTGAVTICQCNHLGANGAEMMRVLPSLTPQRWRPIKAALALAHMLSGGL